MVAGSMDITDAAALPLIQAAERGLKIWAVADSIGDVVGIAVRTDSGIQSPSDLAGKRWPIPEKDRCNTH
jgi:ABC-type taurine transport system substrate-binding protein